jgi:hypothetical protein
MKNYKKSNILERIEKYEDTKEQMEYWKNECERIEDNVIKKINKIDSEIEAILLVLNDINSRLPSRTNRNTPNSTIKKKVDKSIERGSKIKNKANKRDKVKKEK